MMRVKDRADWFMGKYLQDVSRSPHTHRLPCIPSSKTHNSIYQIQFSPNDVTDNVIAHRELELITSHPNTRYVHEIFE